MPTPRLESGRAAILWVALGRDDLQLDRLESVTARAARIAPPAEARGGLAPAAGQEIRFDLLDDAGAAFATGLAKVVAVDAAGGIEIAFLALGIDPGLVIALGAAVAFEGARPKQAPPPLPAHPAPQPPPLRQAPPPLPAPPAATRPAALHDAGAAARPAPAAAARVVDGADDDVAAELEQLQVRRQGVIIGIDLGTTFTCASYVEDGRPRIIPSRTGTSTIPSMITFDPDGSWYVGQRAADRQILYPLRTVYGSKRLVGRTYRAELAAELQQHFAYPLGEADGRRFGVRLDDRVISMDTIAARVLDEVRSTAEAHLGRPVEAAVITVPAYFSEVQRDAVRRAAREANLVVHRIVNEPTAAAVAYGHKQPGEKRARIAVWDFGGGTFDFSIVEVADGQIEVLATGGDNFVGGTDLDDLVASHLLAEFQRALGREIDPEPQQIARLREAGEVAKRHLSVETEYRVELPEFTRDPKRALSVEVTRERFEEMARPLIDRTVAIGLEVMASANLSPADIDDVVLVGGTTRIPAVQRAVAELFGRRPSKRINPDEAVAVGAALLADEIGSGAPTLVDILPMSVGYGVTGLRFLPIVARHARLPASQTLTLDADHLGNVTVPLFQGESLDVTANEYLCSVIVEDRSLWDKGKVSLDVSFDEHCVMAIEARNARTGRPLPARLDRTRPLDDVLRELGKYAGPPQEARWQAPPTRLGAALGKLFKLFGR